METLIRDLRFAARLFGKNSGLTLIVVASLALAIGANTLAFSLVHGVLLRRLPYAEPENLVSLRSSQIRGEIEGTGLSYADYRDLIGQATALSQGAAHRESSFTLAGGHAGPERISGRAASANLFSLLGVEPLLGRSFHQEEDRPGAPGVALISHRLWMRHFGGDRNVLGRSILLDFREHTIIGVMPVSFTFPDRSDIWIPLAPLVHDDPRTYRDLHVVARLEPGASLEKAREETAAIAARLAHEYPDSNAGWTFRIRRLRDEMTGNLLRLIVLSTMGAVAFILLIACANIANLLLARAADRQREIATRLAFGAGRGRIVRQLLTESVLLALVGGGLGTLLAVWGIRWVDARIPTESALPSWARFEIDGPVLGFTLAMSVAAGLLFGLAPALRTASMDLRSTLAEGARGTSDYARGRLYKGLVILEIALSAVVLLGSSLFVRSFLELRNASGGFATEGILTLRAYLGGDAYAEDAARTRRVEDLIQRLEGLPGIEAVGISNNIPLAGGGSRRAILPEGWTVVHGEEPAIFYTGVTPHFFAALGVPLLAGRGFAEREALERSGVAVVNRSFAERFWPGRNAVGQRFRVIADPEAGWISIIGVVPDIKTDAIDKRTPASAYVPFPYQTATFAGILVRTQRDPADVMKDIRREIHASDPNIPLFEVAPMETVRRQGFWEYRLFSGLFAVLAGMALFLAALGIYGVLSHSVNRRRRELGIRLAVGARPTDLLLLTMRQGLLLVFAGLLLGLAGGLAMTRWIRGILYNVSATDPVSFVSILILLIAIAALAIYLPARRAAKMDPLEVLQAE